MRKSFLERIFIPTICTLLVLLSAVNVYGAERAARLISSRGQVEAILPSSSGWQKIVRSDGSRLAAAGSKWSKCR